jgi:catechol 2,3-dioxygenase-like lactoylglutathione lyase family enzyme
LVWISRHEQLVYGEVHSGFGAQTIMLIYTTLGVSDFERSVRFYDATLSTLSIARAPDWTPDFKGWGVAYEQGLSLWICKPFDGGSSQPGNGPMLAFRATTHQQVQSFHSAALAHGGTSVGEPGPRPHYGEDFYACYVRDPDGNKLACVVSQLEARSA